MYTGGEVCSAVFGLQNSKYWTKQYKTKQHNTKQNSTKQIFMTLNNFCPVQHKSSAFLSSGATYGFLLK